MKAVVRLLVRFIFWFALIILGAAALLVAHAYVIGFDPSGASSASPFVSRLLHALSVVWLPSVLVAAVVALFSAARAFEAPAVALGALFLVWTGALLAGGLLSALPDAQVSAPTPVLPERRLVRAGTLRLYPLARSGTIPAPLVLYDGARDPGFSTVEAARIDPDTGELVLPESALARGPEGRSTVDLTRLANSYPAMVRTPDLLRGLLDDIVETSALLSLTVDRRLTGVLNLVALGVFLMGSWTLVRLTRWPLFNVVLALGALRLALWAVPAVQSGVLRDLLIAAFDSRALPFASAILLAGLGIGLLAALVFLPPLPQWRREVGHG